MVAPWHERRSKESRLANLGGVSSKELVRECGLSVGHFSQWLPVLAGSDTAPGVSWSSLSLFKAA